MSTRNTKTAPVPTWPGCADWLYVAAAGTAHYASLAAQVADAARCEGYCIICNTIMGIRASRKYWNDLAKKGLASLKRRAAASAASARRRPNQ